MEDIRQQIAEEYHREMSAVSVPRTAFDIPRNYEAITCEWLTSVLCREFPSAVVTEFRLTDRDDANTNRIRIHLSYNDRGNTYPLPESIFCKASHDLQVRMFLGCCHLIDHEALFYSRYKPYLDIEAPRCIHANYDDTSCNSIFLFDDLALQSVMFCNHTTDITFQHAENQVSMLAKLHGRFYGQQGMGTESLRTFEHIYDCFDQFFDEETVSNHGFDLALDVIPRELHGKRTETWQRTLQSIESHASYPRTLLHNDVHLRNWYIKDDSAMGLADWQVIVSGLWARDLSHVMTTSLSVENRRRWERDLIAVYLEKFRASGGPAIGFDESWKLYRQQMFTSLMWWTSTLSMQYTQPHDSCLEFIKRISTAIQDTDAFRSF